MSPKIAVALALPLILLSSLSGCGSSNPPAETTGGTQNPAPAQAVSGGAPSAADNTASGSPVSSTERKPNERWTDSNGREYLGNVPLDVFFDQPYTIASDTTALGGAPAPVGGMAEANVPAMAANNPPAEAPSTATPAAGSTTWEDLTTMETLTAEITSIRNFFNQTLQSVGSYNSSMLMIPPKAATVAALAQVAIDHPEDLTWKEDAKYIRDIAKKMNESPLMRGKKDQSRLQILFENMTDTFNRSRPAGLEEPPEEDGFADVADMGSIMARMNDAKDKMTTEAGSKSAFSSKKDMVVHEASILATLTHVTTLEGYGYAEDDEFKGYANQIVEAAKTIKTSAETSDFGAYELALSKISTSCQECHSVYRNN